MRSSFKNINVIKIICYIILFLFFLICLYLRFKNLDLWGLSGDELVTAKAPNFIDRRCYIYAFIINCFARCVIFITGKNFVSESLLRFPSALAALITIPVLWVIGKKLKDEFTSLIFISLFTFSFYLISYARDARFYSFYFLASCFVLYTVINILSSENKDKRSFYFWLLMYVVSMIFSMGIHQGSYLFYATSNIFLSVIIIASVFKNFNGKNYKSIIFELLIQLLIICIPVFVIAGLLFKISKGELYNSLNKNYPLLTSLSWNSLKSIQISFYQLYPYANFIFVFTTFLPIYLLFKKKYRLISLYCIFVKYATFVFLYFLPQSVVKEPLREKYILYIFSLDLMMLSLGISMLFYDFSKLIALIYRKYSFIIQKGIYYFISISILIWFSINMFNKIQKSKIYHQRNQTIRLVAEKLDDVGDNDIIIVFGKFGGRNVVLDYEKRRSPKRDNWKWFSNPNSYKSILPAENKGFIWYVILGDYLNSDGYVDTIWSDKSFSIYKSKMAISDDKNKIAVLTSEVLKNTDSRNPLYNRFLSSVSNINSDILSEMYSTPKSSKYFLDENLVLNGSFLEKGKYWHFPKSLIENEDFSYNSQDDISYLTLKYKPGTRPHFSQNFAVVSGMCYKISASFKNNNIYKGDLLNAYLVVYAPNDKKGQNLIFYDTYRQWTTKSMIFKPNCSGKAIIQIWNGFANIPHETVADCTGIIVQREVNMDFTNNILRNGNFTNVFNCWKLNKFNNEITVEKENLNTNVVKIYNVNGKSASISQSFNIVSGMFYNILFSARKEEADSKSGAFLVLRGTEVDKSKEHYLFMKNVKTKWGYNYYRFKAHTTGQAFIYLKTGNDKIKETIFYKDVFITED